MYVHVFEALRCVYDWKHKCEMLFKVGNSHKVSKSRHGPSISSPAFSLCEVIRNHVLRDSPQIAP